MDYCKRESRQKSPNDRANIFSLLTFSYLSGLWKKAYQHKLNDENLYEVLEQCESEKCGDKLEREWINEKKIHENPSLARILWKCWGKLYLITGLVTITWKTSISVVKPFVLSEVVAYFTPGQTRISENQVFMYASVMFLLHISDLVYYHNYLLYMQTLGVEMKTSFSSLLYRKSLKLSPEALERVSVGNIVNLITRDVHSFVQVITTINDALIAITQLIIICYLLFNKIGVVSFFGIGILLCSIPIQFYLSVWITKLRLVTGKKTDERLQISQEILSTIKIIKMYTWELFFTDNVIEARRKETMNLFIGIYLKKLLLFVAIIFTGAGFYVLIIACIWIGISTDTAVIFYIISNFRDLRMWLAITIPAGLGSISDFVSAYKRIREALMAEELIQEQLEEQTTKGVLLKLKDVTVKINDKEILQNVSFEITSGLTLITGAVGSGKSSVLKTILRDYTLSSGTITTQGRISYASQDPWLFPSTVKQNILFGEPFNQSRYQEVVRVCALLYDFNLFDNGDETILIDRGSNLSKGQQARINLARAAYRESEIYLLDDSLTALDATVQDYIFRECIQGFLKDKICVLVTQSNKHISRANNVIIMDKGKIKHYGKPSECISKELEEEDVELENKVEDKEEKKMVEKKIEKKNIYGELKKEGSVNLRVYKKYLVYGGGTVIILLNVIFRVFTTFSLIYTDKLLTNWVDANQNVLTIQNMSDKANYSYYNLSLEEAKSSEHYIFQLYTIFLVLSNALEIFTTFLIVNFFRKASLNLHTAMIKKVINAVMLFFDTHLVGNILNRLSQDLNNIDENLTYAIEQCARILSLFVGSLILLIILNQQMIIVAILIIFILLVLRHIYMPAGRCLKRLEASTRSPMIGYLNATLEGLTTIRACKIQKTLIKEYDKHQNLYTSAHYLSNCSNRGFGFLVDIACSMFVLFLLIKYLFFYTNTTAGNVGLSITQVFNLTVSITWSIRQLSDLENNMTSLERILEYTDVQTEEKNGAVIEDWPKTGAISYKGVSLYYNNQNYVLKNLNFDVKPGENIGIVGRTGAGKSSIISSLFRLYEIEGGIFIDGVDTKTLALDFLRKHIAVIPQDPVLFSGTIRTNLDPLNEFQDYQIWEALEKAELKPLFSSLNERFTSTNSNFSSGQKQLICLSRAILRNNQIIIMDEASANMDQETDALLHKIIRDNFSNCTILMIAHRLHSIMGCDKILVLDKGEIKEYGSPKVLLENNYGLFYKMVKTVGLLNGSKHKSE